ncbi:helix-turn-helix domain-containing protein [Clostridium sp.]|uniref:helix-turn-helix domain-containing protein n=1 Tax=Clostridium sp. TaxID=1506 RepID=UPI0025C35317|nr:helix-turn-helix domain-containing protein [Clostridium sp.]MDU2106544.1 helix-turn-helix domain-containing protein [Clostridium sp.]MDU3353588.1 helix-turn-helix domain-containing protein [Clostridium sp.]
MKIDEDKFRKFCEDNNVDKNNENVLRKLCYLVANNEIIMTTIEEDLMNISKFSRTKDKVKYLRDKGYTQEKVGEMLKISRRQVQRIENKLKNKM